VWSGASFLLRHQQQKSSSIRFAAVFISFISFISFFSLSFGRCFVFDQAPQLPAYVPLARGHLDAQGGLDRVEVQQSRAVIALRQREPELERLATGQLLLGHLRIIIIVINIMSTNIISVRL
jgi:hypothetical protein